MKFFWFVIFVSEIFLLSRIPAFHKISGRFEIFISGIPRGLFLSLVSVFIIMAHDSWDFIWEFQSKFF